MKELGKIVDEQIDNSDKYLDILGSEKVQRGARAIVIMCSMVISYYAGYGLGKLADYGCKKITHKQIYEHFQKINFPKIQLPTEIQIDYKNSISNGSE